MPGVAHQLTPVGPAVKTHPISAGKDGDVRQRITQGEEAPGTGKIGVVQLTLRHVSAASMQGGPAPFTSQPCCMPPLFSSPVFRGTSRHLLLL